MAFVRWDPLRDLLDIQQRMNRLAPGAPGWTPLVDILETPDSYVITAELPGVSEGDIQLQMQDGQLTISGFRVERQSPCEQFHRIERGHGSFSRTFHLPAPVDTDRITAELRDGVLTVTCSKSADGPSRRIQIG